MARCDEGYRCHVCGVDVAAITESALYLQYVLGEVPLEELSRRPECHIRCLPSLAQFIVDPAFPPVVCGGPFAKQMLDPDFVRQEEQRVTQAWRRLQAIPRLGLAVHEYPLHVTPSLPEEENSCEPSAS